MKTKILILFLISAICYGALPANVTWEVRNGGNDNNGGGFLPGATGTDYSLSASNHCTSSDFTLAAGTTLATSVLCPFGADSVGNIINVTAGTNCTVARYHVVSVSVVTATLDRAAGTTGCTAGTFFVGGAIKTLSQLNTAMSTTNVSQHAYVKSDSTYSISAGVTFNFNASSGIFVDITGYTTTRPTLTTPGDGGMPTVQATAGSFTMITLANNNSAFNVQFQNFILDGNAQTAMTCASMNNNDDIFRNIKTLSCGTGFKEGGFRFTCERCVATTMSSNNGSGFVWANGGDCTDCYSGDSSATGMTGFQFTSGHCVRCVVANLTGSTNSNGFAIAAMGQGGIYIESSVCYNVTQTCLNYQAATSSNTKVVTIKNSIMAKAAAYCFDSSNASPLTIIYGGFYEDYNACWSNGGTGTYHLWTAGTHDIALTADPFTNGASHNFALNSTAGGGAALKGLGFPGTFLVGGTGHQDIGTFQSGTGGVSGNTVSSYAN